MTMTDAEYYQTLTIQEFFSQVDSNLYYMLILIYVSMIAVGLVQNLSIIIACIWNDVPKTARNLLISYLAVCDILLCLLSMPLTLMDLIHWWWPIGSGQEILCKIAMSSQSVFVFLSSFLVVIVAMDRMRFIVTPDKVQLSNTMGSLLSLAGLVLSVVLTFPLFHYTTIEVLFKDASYCFEFLIPSVVVSLAYLMIYFTFNESQQRVARTECLTATSIRKKNRRRKTNILLCIISIVFFVSWAPLNIFTVVMNTFHPIEDEETLVIIFAVCHLIGMSTTCSNPVLYVWLNKNFKLSCRPQI